MLFNVEKGEVQVTPSTQIIIAALNEEEGIGPTIAELKEYFGEAKTSWC